MSKISLKDPQEHIVDELLVIQVQSGDRRALSLLIKRWHVKILKQAYRHLRNMDTAKDIAQDSWVAIIKGIHTLKDPSLFATWAMTITSRKSVDWIRKKQRSRRDDTRLILPEVDDQQASSNKEENRLKAMMKALKEIKSNQRTILSMYYLDGYSVGMIAEILSIPKGTVKSRLFHAREKLKNTIKTKYNENE